MALINCVECRLQISDKATNCPNCGCPIEKSIEAPQSAHIGYFFKYKGLIFWLLVIGYIVMANSKPSTKPNEADVVNKCDHAAQTQAKNPSSVNFAWSWDTSSSNREMVIKRNFTAMNGFGANIDHYYVCTYNTVAGKLGSFEIYEGNLK
jgi:hypothetical protein